MDDYHEDTEWATKSQLWTLRHSAADYHDYYVSRTRARPASNTAMDVGSILHAVLLERRPLDDVACVYPAECCTASGALNGKAAAAFREQAGGKFCLKQSDYGELAVAVATLSRNELISDAVRDSKAIETPHLRDYNGTRIKCKPDIVTRDGLLFDLKCSSDIHPVSFHRSASRFGYWLQDVHYAACVGTEEPMRFMAVETTFPYRVHVYQYARESRLMAMREHERLLGELDYRRQSDNWDDGWPMTVPLRSWELSLGDDDALIEVGDLL